MYITPTFFVLFFYAPFLFGGAAAPWDRPPSLHKAKKLTKTCFVFKMFISPKLKHLHTHQTRTPNMNTHEQRQRHLTWKPTNTRQQLTITGCKHPYVLRAVVHISNSPVTHHAERSFTDRCPAMYAADNNNTHNLAAGALCPALAKHQRPRNNNNGMPQTTRHAHGAYVSTTESHNSCNNGVLPRDNTVSTRCPFDVL